MPSMVPSCYDCINVSNRSWSIQQQKDHSNWTRRLSLPQRIHSLGGHLLYYDPCNTLAMVTQMRSRSGRSPWFLAYDPYIDAVILSIRGTKSLRDVMTSINNRSLFPSFTIRNGSYSEYLSWLSFTGPRPQWLLHNRIEHFKSSSCTARSRGFISQLQANHSDPSIRLRRSFHAFLLSSRLPITHDS